MIWQYLTVGLIILIAITVSIFRLVKYLKNPLRKCNGCSSNCSGCALEELKKEMKS